MGTLAFDGDPGAGGSGSEAAARRAERASVRFFAAAFEAQFSNLSRSSSCVPTPSNEDRIKAAGSSRQRSAYEDSGSMPVLMTISAFLCDEMMAHVG